MIRKPEVDSEVSKLLSRPPKRRPHAMLEAIAQSLAARRDVASGACKLSIPPRRPITFDESDRLTLKSLRREGYGWPSDGVLFEALRDDTLNVVDTPRK